MIKFSIVITTYNRLADLKITLKSLDSFLQRDDVELLICDDASTDGTQVFLKNNYKNDTLIFNNKGNSYIYNRNALNNRANGEYIISLDDDACFLSESVLKELELCFINHPNCGVQNLRIYWGKEKPITTTSTEVIQLSKGFVGCGHVWRKTAWESIPKYPVWFVFYGEEDFAAYQLFKHDWDVLYNPKVLVHHRVDIKARKKHKDYRLRLRRSLRSGWYLYFLFYPLKEIPRRFTYTIWQQLKKKTFKGDIKATTAIIQALLDVIINLPRLIKYANRLSNQEFKEYQKLSDTKLYWSPEKES